MTDVFKESEADAIRAVGKELVATVREELRGMLRGVVPERKPPPPAPKAEGGEVSDEERECPHADCCQNEPCSGPGNPNITDLACEYEAADSSDGPAQQHQNGLCDVWNLGKGHGFRAGRASLAAELEAEQSARMREAKAGGALVARLGDELAGTRAALDESRRIEKNLAADNDGLRAELAEKDRRIAELEAQVALLAAAASSQYGATFTAELRPGGKGE